MVCSRVALPFRSLGTFPFVRQSLLPHRTLYGTGMIRLFGLCFSGSSRLFGLEGSGVER